MGKSQDTFWTFTRGSEQISLVREADSQGFRLWVRGPGPETVTHEFPDFVECLRHQARIERKLLADGFQFTRLGTTDHRAEPAKCSDADNGRMAK